MERYKNYKKQSSDLQNNFDENRTLISYWFDMVLKFGIILIVVMYSLRMSTFKKRKSFSLGIFILILFLMMSMSKVS